MNWSFRAFTLSGIAVRIHWTLPLILLSEVVRWGLAATEGFAGIFLGYAALLMTGYWLSILIHELGHCAAARTRGIPAEEILLWPLGGLAYVGGSGTPRNEVAIAFAGPLASFLLAGLCFALVFLSGHPFGWELIVPFDGWGQLFGAGFLTALAIDLFKLNLILGLFNLCIPAYPLDGGRILRGLLSRRIGFGRATEFCTKLAIGVAVVLGFWGLIQQELWLVLIGIFVGIQAFQERKLLREGALPGYDATFMGHDFSRGYTSLEADDAEPREERRGSGLFTALRRRASERRARHREEEQARLRERVDQLLDKVKENGMASLSPEERQFLEDASRQF
jgi:Zn-dependent protease